MALQNNAAADDRTRDKPLSRSAIAGLGWALALAVLLALAALTISWSAPAAAEGLAERAVSERSERRDRRTQTMRAEPFTIAKTTDAGGAAPGIAPLRRSWTPAPGRAGTLALIHGLRTQRAGPH
ncbi:MAG: hypothetical protein AAF909_12280 [Pseudomonadota bacterium]